MEIVGVVLLGAMLLVSALAVVLMPNALYSALCLIVNLVSVALLFLMMNAQFLFVSQILIYAGAIVVLFLFGVTILNPETDTVLSAQNRNQFLATILIVAVLAGLLVSLVSRAAINGTPGTYGNMVEVRGDVAAFGIQLFTVYLLPLEATAIILLIGIVGAVVLGRQEIERTATTRRYQIQRVANPTYRVGGGATVATPPSTGGATVGKEMNEPRDPAGVS